MATPHWLFPSLVSIAANIGRWEKRPAAGMMGMMHVQALKAPSFSLPSHTGRRVEVLSFNQSRAS